MDKDHKADSLQDLTIVSREHKMKSMFQITWGVDSQAEIAKREEDTTVNGKDYAVVRGVAVASWFVTIIWLYSQIKTGTTGQSTAL